MSVCVSACVCVHVGVCVVCVRVHVCACVLRVCVVLVSLTSSSRPDRRSAAWTCEPPMVRWASHSS